MILPKWLYKEMIKRNFDDGFKRGYNDALHKVFEDLVSEYEKGMIGERELNKWVVMLRRNEKK